MLTVQNKNYIHRLTIHFDYALNELNRLDETGVDIDETEQLFNMYDEYVDTKEAAEYMKEEEEYMEKEGAVDLYLEDNVESYYDTAFGN
jgi:hypothetical protein